MEIEIEDFGKKEKIAREIKEFMLHDKIKHHRFELGMIEKDIDMVWHKIPFEITSERVLEKITIGYLNKILKSLKSLIDVSENFRFEYHPENELGKIILLRAYLNFFKNIPLKVFPPALQEDIRIIREKLFNIISIEDFSGRRYEKDIRQLQDRLAVEKEERLKLEKTNKQNLEKAEENLKQANDLLQNSASSIIIKEYAEEQKEEEKISKHLFWWSITLLLSGGLVVALIFSECFTNINLNPKINQFFFKLSVYLIFLIPAIYIMEESKKHAEQSFKLRDFSLKIRAIPLYLDKVADKKSEELSEREKTKLEIAKSIFTTERISEDNSKNKTEITKIATEALEKIATSKI